MRIRPITRDDTTEVAAFFFETFRDDALYQYLYPKQGEYPDDLRRYQLIRLRTRLVTRGQPGFVVVTEQGDADWTGKPEVVGFAYYDRSGKDEGAAKWRQDSLFNKLERQLLEWEAWYARLFDRARDNAHIEAFVKLAPYKYFKALGAYWRVSLLAVSPKHQRRGVGSMLVKHCQDLAAEEGLPLALESSVPGRGMYLRNGFKIVHESVVLDGFVNTIMLWEPANLRGKWLEDIEGDTAKVKNARKASN